MELKLFGFIEDVLQTLEEKKMGLNQVAEEIESFFEKLVQNIILHKEQGKPLVVLINDVNSNNRGRDYFEKLVEKLDGEGLIENSQGYYFDYNIRNEFQRYGIKHESNRIVYNIPDRLSTYRPWEVCSSAQLLIEVL